MQKQNKNTDAHKDSAGEQPKERSAKAESRLGLRVRTGVKGLILGGIGNGTGFDPGSRLP